MSDRKWVVYLLRCSDGSLYCGATNDLFRRIEAHNTGLGAKYTKSRCPVKLAAVSHKMTKGEAFKLEYKIKRMPAGNKIAALKTASIE